MNTQPPSNLTDDTKVCPYCAETIKRAAVVCRYCGRELPIQPSASAATVTPSAPRAMQVSQIQAKKPVAYQPPKKTGCGTLAGYVLIILLFFGGVLVVASLTMSPKAGTINTVASTPTSAKQIVATSMAPTPMPTATKVLATGVSYDQICNINESNMTDPQLQQHAASFADQTFTGWKGWVYNVVSGGNGTYDLQIAMKERGIFWSRNIEVDNIPSDLAAKLNVEQPLLFDGRVKDIKYAFNVMCNPMIIDNFVMR